MAIFLLIYVVLVLVWIGWSLLLLYHVYKYRFPKDKSLFVLAIFGGFSVFILIISIIFISRADWVTIPAFLGGK